MDAAAPDEIAHPAVAASSSATHASQGRHNWQLLHLQLVLDHAARAADSVLLMNRLFTNLTAAVPQLLRAQVTWKAWQQQAMVLAGR
jgi:hypothetical protein